MPPWRKASSSASRSTTTASASAAPRGRSSFLSLGNERLARTRLDVGDDSKLKYSRQQFGESRRRQHLAVRVHLRISWIASSPAKSPIARSRKLQRRGHLQHGDCCTERQESLWTRKSRKPNWCKSFRISETKPGRAPKRGRFLFILPDFHHILGRSAQLKPSFCPFPGRGKCRGRTPGEPRSTGTYRNGAQSCFFSPYPFPEGEGIITLSLFSRALPWANFLRAVGA